ncbi:MAG TPA: DUF1249 domain-containing protein [Gammaproteobacteria bacterium]|nr:DUF1249 domain-containing protein [Gammaproteobacteria bacterium]
MEIRARQQDHTTGAARTFGGLMDIYEQNYIRLRRLIPDFDKIGEKAISTVPNGVDLHYQCLQRSKYTTVFSLTYKFETLEPNLEIRVYHDARVAEVLACNVRMEDVHWDGKVSSLFRYGLHNLHSRWRLNRFLNKWLHYCLKQGHKFVPHSSSWVRAVSPGEI